MSVHHPAQQQLREAKRLARLGVVHVTENGRSGYVLCSLEIYEWLLGEARAKGAWQAGVEDVAKTSSRDISEGRMRDFAAVVDASGEPHRSTPHSPAPAPPTATQPSAAPRLDSHDMWPTPKPGFTQRAAPPPAAPPPPNAPHLCPHTP